MTSISHIIIGYMPETQTTPLKSDYETIVQKSIQFLRTELEAAGRTGFVVGLSGGIDSSLCATLAVRAVGAHKLFGVMMPYRTSSPNSLDDARLMAEWLEIEHKIVDISPMIDAYFLGPAGKDKIRAGNKMARERMSILFDIASEHGGLVLGTGNRTEIALGYTTLFGDAACSLNPIGELYKTEIRQLAGFLELPEPIQTKAPSADLWEGQTDEDEIGLSYDEIDRLLEQIIDKDERSRAHLMGQGFSAKKIERVVSLLNQNSFKRRLPPIASFDKSPIPHFVRLLD
ncbi:MAG: NAD+ synthase [candidate division Zixibacteria bacterium]|nr:NAD+ synthase [candidate division Zixibacteria bacterium]